MKSFANFIFLLPLLFINTSYAQTLEECNALASDSNTQYPSRVDKVTTIKSLICYLDNKKVVLSYNMIIDTDGGSSINQKAINTLRPSMLNTLCTDPDTILLLTTFPIAYKYYFDNGKYIGELKFSVKECK